MAQEREIREARAVLRNFRGRIGTKSSRIHKEAMSSNLDRQRALDGLCGNCRNLNIRFYGNGKARGVMLYCIEGYIPAELCAKTPPGEAADCPGFPLEAKVE